MDNVTARILVVDDMPEMQQFMAALLGNAGYWVLTASTLEAGMRLAEDADPDLVVVDIRLGSYNGLQLAIRERITHPTRPVIVISGDADPVLEAEANRFGARFLPKPLHPKLLLATIEQMLEPHGSSSEPQWHTLERRHASTDRRQQEQSAVHDRRRRGRRTTDG
jgi:DNA-binding response OmpR family regulator